VFDNQTALEFREGGEHMKDQLAVWCRGPRVSTNRAPTRAFREILRDVLKPAQVSTIAPFGDVFDTN